ncbi:MAG: HAMP domain-containing histidine kinase, partial [Bacilli bacterium]|nr:HAMP domain-containing histidine kinase [Bacilli bacterium]
SRQLNPGKTFLITSIIVLAAGTLVTFGIAVLVSKRLVKPIEDSQKSQKRFISDASHQMKTPLTIISANDEIIEMEHGESESTRIIAKEVDILTKMVRSLNTLAVLDEGGKLEKTDFDLSSLVSEQAGIFQKSLKEKGFDVKIQDGIVYNGNQANIHELVEIILDNARKYAKSKISLSLEKVEDRIVLIERNDTAEFEEGIHDEVFGRFYRSDDARVAVSDGSGIGLSIAKEIVLAHGGRIYCYGENNDFILKVQL